MEDYVRNVLVPAIQMESKEKNKLLLFLDFLMRVLNKQKNKADLKGLKNTYKQTALIFKEFLPNQFIYFNILLKLHNNLVSFEQQTPLKESKMLLRRILT